MKKKYFFKKQLSLLVAMVFATVSAFAGSSSLPNNIQVSGITSPSDANGVYVKQGTLKANIIGTTDYTYSYWQYTSGTHTYYLYLHQYSNTFYSWNIDDNMDDASVLFYNSDNGGNGYQADPTTNAPIGAPSSPELVLGWGNAYGTGIGVPVVQAVPAAPVVTTQAASDITSTTATGNITLTDIGYPTPVTAYGVCWNTTGGRVVENATSNGITSATGTSTVALSGLTPNTKYYIRAYATNATGTSYGTVQTFVTSATTGLDNTTLGALTLYPNPTTNGFYVDVQNMNAKVAVYDLSGSVQLTQQAFGKTYIDITSLKEGIYMVKITTANGTVTKKIAKK